MTPGERAAVDAAKSTQDLARYMHIARERTNAQLARLRAMRRADPVMRETPRVD